MGDLRRSSLREIWQGEALRDFRLTHLEGRRHTLAACRSCTFLDTSPDDLDGLMAETFRARTARLATAR